jgi:hypothetical protein
VFSFGSRSARWNEFAAKNAALEPLEKSQPIAGRGHVFPINAGDKQVDWSVYYALPSSLRAHDLDDVQTIALLKYEDEVAAAYAGGGAGYRRVCQITLIDRQTGQFVGSEVCSGGEPPSVVRSGTNGFGSAVSTEVLAKTIARISQRAGGADTGAPH